MLVRAGIPAVVVMSRGILATRSLAACLWSLSLGAVVQQDF